MYTNSELLNRTGLEWALLDIWKTNSNDLGSFKNECSGRIFCISKISLNIGEDGSQKSAQEMICKALFYSFEILAFMNCEFDWNQIWQLYRD